MSRTRTVVCQPRVIAALLVLLSAQVVGSWEPLEVRASREARTSVARCVCMGSDTTAAEPARDGKSQTVNATELGKSVPELPFGITSFGAAKIGNAIYVYGGHTGTAHRYWNTSQSNQLLRWDTNAVDARWEVVSEGTDRLLVHDDKLYVVGGWNMESGKFLQPEVIRIESATGVTVR